MKAIYILFFLGFLSITSSAQTLDMVMDMEHIRVGVDPSSDNNIMVQDAAGNTYLCGEFWGETDFDLGPDEYLMDAGDVPNMAGFILKLDTDGNFVWAKMVGSSEFTIINSINMNSMGDLILSGVFSDDVDFDPGEEEYIVSSPDGNGVFVLNLSNDGEFNWVRSFLGLEGNQRSYLDLDGVDNIYLTSLLYSLVDVDPSENEYILESDGTLNTFVVKLDANGQFVWGNSFGGNGPTRIRAINITDNEIVLTGTFGETANLNPTGELFEVTAVGSSDAFVSKFSLDGVFELAFTLSGEGYERISEIRRDSDGNILMIGTFSEEIVFNEDETLAITSGVDPNSDAFFAKYSPIGELIWAKSIGGEGYDTGNCIDVDGSGSVYLSGLYRESLDVDPGAAELIFSTPLSGTGSYFIKLNGLGELMWGHNFNSSSTVVNEVFIHNFLINDLGELQVSGSYCSNTDFDPDPYAQVYLGEPPSGVGRFLAKYSLGPCDDLSVSFDSVSYINCISSGYISGVAHNGVEPYQYEWNTSPTISGSFIEPTSAGLYALSVTDADGCSKTAIVNIEEPGSLTQQDLLINMLSSEFRTGFPASVWVDGLNDGCEAISGTISMVKDPLIDFNSATIAPNEIIGDSLVWNFENYVYESGHFQSALNFTTSLEAQIGDTICFDIYINPQDGDANPENNHRHYCYPVVNGYDPNDKQVYPQGECEDHYTLNDEVLTYTVRFQNTGNSEAINIHVIDSLSPFLDINTLSVVAKSHDMFTEVLPGNVLNFKFDNILLPDSAGDEVNSQGYVIFEISPMSDLLNGTVIENTSEIYFDFNPAVVTNTTFNTLVDEIPSCDFVDGLEEGKSRINLSVYPNPASSHIELRCEYEMNQISVYDFAGRLVLESNVRVTQFQLELKSLNVGIYFIHVQTLEGMAVKKVVVN